MDQAAIDRLVAELDAQNLQIEKEINQNANALAQFRFQMQLSPNERPATIRQDLATRRRGVDIDTLLGEAQQVLVGYPSSGESRQPLQIPGAPAPSPALTREPSWSSNVAESFRSSSMVGVTPMYPESNPLTLSSTSSRVLTAPYPSPISRATIVPPPANRNNRYGLPPQSEASMMVDLPVRPQQPAQGELERIESKKTMRQDLPSLGSAATQKRRPIPPVNSLDVGKTLGMQLTTLPFGVQLPYNDLSKAKALSSPELRYLPDLSLVTEALLVNRPRMALRGIHIVVHDTYASVSSNQEFEAAYESMLPNYIYPTQWDGANSDPTFDRSVEHKGWTGGDLADVASAKVSNWYPMSAKKMALDSTDESFKSRCFTIDIDPTLYSTKQKELETLFATVGKDPKTFLEQAKKLQYAVDQRAFRSFLATMNEAFTSAGARQFDLVNESLSPTNWQYAEQSSRRYAMFMRDWSEVSKNTAGLLKLASHNATRSAIHWFLRNQWCDYDSILAFMPKFRPTPESKEALYRKNFFIEIIGFATAEDWQSAQHDFSLDVSRREAWQVWSNRVSRFEDEPYTVHGFYTMQRLGLAPYACSSIQKLNSTLKYYNEEAENGDGFLGSIVPVTFMANRPYDDNETTNYFPKVAMLKRLPSALIQNSFIKDYMDFLQSTGHDLPVFFTQNALIPFPTQPVFRRDDFGWLAPAPQSPKSLGIGGYGQVLRVRYQHSTHHTVQDHRPMVSHHVMIMDMLQQQKQYLKERLTLVSSDARESAAQDYADSPALQSLVLQTSDGTLQVIDFAQQESIELYDTAIEIVNHLTGAEEPLPDSPKPADPTLLERFKNFLGKGESEAQILARSRRELIRKLYTGYSADVKIGVAVKYGERQFGNRAEAMVAQMCHLEEPVDLVGVTFDAQGKKVVGSQMFKWRPTTLSCLIDTEVLPFDDTTSLVRLRSTVGDKTYNFNFSCPTLLARNKRQVTVDVELNANYLMNSYGTGYDNQFCFLVMPIASKGSLRSQIDAAIIAQVEATGVVPRFGKVDRSVSAIIDAKTSYVSQSPERLLSPIELLQCLSDALNGIRFLNAKGIAHSDIKLENILVSGVRSAAVTDFGLARPYGVPLNGTFGTPGYYPAELEKMLPDFCIVDPLLDSYAFGMCLQNVIKQGRPYSQPNTARFVGASFNRAELGVLMRKEPELPLDDILAPYFLYRPEDDITPVAQRPLSIEMANLFVSTLSMCADILTKQKFVDDAKTTFRTRTSLRDHKVMESNIINRLLGVQIMLDWLLEMLFKSAKNQ